MRVKVQLFKKQVFLYSTKIETYLSVLLWVGILTGDKVHQKLLDIANQYDYAPSHVGQKGDGHGELLK